MAKRQGSSNPRFYLSASRDSGGRSQLFRPKNLNEYVFNRVGLVMYNLFWVKFGVVLAQRGYDPLNQAELLLWTRDETDEIAPTESILYYSFLSHYDDTAEDTHPGSTIIRNWLLQSQKQDQYGFYGGPYERLIDELFELQADPESYDFEGITDGVLAPWIRTRCHEQNIEIEERMTDSLYSTATENHETEAEQMEALIASFTTTLGEILQTDPDFYRHKDTNPIGQNLQVAEMLSETDHEALTRFGNTDVRFTSADREALFEILSGFEKGRRLIHSFIFMSYLDPTASSTDTDRLRNIYQIYTDHPQEVIQRAEDRLDIEFDESTTANIEATSFNYILNFFLTDGETISRKLLASREKSDPVTIEDVDRFFRQNRATLPEISQFEQFLDYTAACERFLPPLIEAYEADNASDIATFLDQVRTELAANDRISKLLLEILAHRGTLAKSGGQTDSYRVEQPPKNTTSASFYGVNRVMDWTRTLLKVAADDEH